MTHKQRILAAMALAAGATGLVAPAAQAATAEQHGVQAPSVLHELDELSASSVPAEHRQELPTVSGQLAGLGQAQQQLGQLHQVTDLIAPVTGLLPAVQT
ncbi:hypothetical protein ACWCP6_23790 [Streptomyces sp. NPDC002004]